jgi:hypothetical protein
VIGYAYNPSYRGGGGRRISSLRPVQEKLGRPYLKREERREEDRREERRRERMLEYTLGM